MTKTILIALTHGGLSSVAEFPYLLQQAGFDVTIIADKRFKPCIGRGYRHWIPSSVDASQLIADIAVLFTADAKAYDWVILSQDELLRALHNSPMSLELKTSIGPIGDAHYLGILGSKCNNSEFCSHTDIQMPPFKICTTQKEIEDAALVIGFPVLVKADHSVSSDGTFKCDTLHDIATASPKFHGSRFLVEKFITGTQIRLEPLFLNGQLIACSAFTVLHAVGDGLGISTRRMAHAAAPYEAMLRKLGSTLQLSGFMSLGLMRDDTTGEVYLFEVDCRPNAWPPYGKFIGADFLAALKDYHVHPDFSPHPYLSIDNQKMVSILWRDLPYSIRAGKVFNLLGWLTNRDQCWRFIPIHDPRLLMYWMIQIALKGFGFLSKKLWSATP